MQTVYQLNADDLNEDFLEGLKSTFKHKEIEIVVYDAMKLLTYLVRLQTEASYWSRCRR